MLANPLQNKQASQSSRIINGACQSTGVKNTDEEQLMEMWPHYHTAHGTHLFHQEEGCKLKQVRFRTSRAGRTKDSPGLWRQAAATRKTWCLMHYRQCGRNWSRWLEQQRRRHSCFSTYAKKTSPMRGLAVRDHQMYGSLTCCIESIPINKLSEFILHSSLEYASMR